MKSISLNSLLLIIIGLFWLLAGCASQPPVETEPEPVPESAPPSLEHVSTVTAVTSFETVQLQAVFAVRNPGDGPLKVEHYRYTLETVTQSSGQAARHSAQQEPGLSIPAGGEETIELTLQLPLAAPLPAEGEETQPEVPFTLHLEANVTGGGEVNRLLEASTDGSIERPRLPRVSVPEVIIRQFETRIIRLEYIVEVQNPNSFAIRYSPQPHEFAFAGKPWAEEELPRGFRLEAGQSTRVGLPLQINYMKAGRRTVDILIGDKTMEYSISGQAEARPAETAASQATATSAYPFSFEHRGTATIIRP
ncbi:MAG: LEA type 2 family protein [Spirochaetota bacterium]